MAVTVPNKVIKRLYELVGERLYRAADGSRVASHLTIKKRKYEFEGILADLYGIGLQLQNPKNIGMKHVEALCEHWESKRYSVSTLQNKICYLRVLCEWLGHPGMVRGSAEHVSNPVKVTRRAATDRDKGLEVTGTHDWVTMVEKALEFDVRIAAMLILGRWFGLRAREALQFRPLQDDLGYALLLSRGTKGGKVRSVEVTPERRWLLDTYVTPLVRRKAESLCWEEKDIEQGYDRLRTQITRKLGLSRREIGVTFHGARHDFINGELERLGYISPIRGGNHASQVGTNPALVQHAINRVIQQAGHARVSIMGAYGGAQGKPGATGKPRLDWGAGRTGSVPTAAPGESDEIQDEENLTETRNVKPNPDTHSIAGQLSVSAGSDGESKGDYEAQPGATGWCGSCECRAKVTR